MLEQLDRARSAARRAAAASAARAPPTPRAPTCSSSSTSPRGRSIGIRAGTTRVSFTTASAADELRQLAEHVVRDLAARARVDEQPRLVAPLGRMLRDQLRRQVVVELAGVHPTRTLASAPMDDVREALREGLREEAAPISRRLAEVKGLSNNAIRRLEGIEQTLESERDARIDDLDAARRAAHRGLALAERAARPDRGARSSSRENVVPLRGNVA